MKKLTVLFTLLVICSLTSVLLAQDYTMYETQYLKVKPGKWQELSANMKAHNRKFHSDDPYKARVWRVVNGKRSGQLVWVMGPCTFTDLDNRPADDDHESDWTGKVESLAEGHHNEYWRRQESLSYVPDDAIHKIIRVRFLDVKDGETYRFRQLFSNITKVYEAKNHPHRLNVYRNRFRNSSGREWATVNYYDKWADLDVSRNFPDDYEEVHGEGSWRLFLEEWEDVVVSADDEYRELMPELGG